MENKSIEKKSNAIATMLYTALKADKLMKGIHFLLPLLFQISKNTIKRLTLEQIPTSSEEVLEDKFYMVRAMAYGALRANWSQHALDTFVKAIFFNNAYFRKVKEMREKYGYGPPSFFVISPTKRCNLKCPGCYANAATESDKLPYWVVSRMIREAKELWGARFFVISGGEPLMYESEGKGILDLYEENRDCIFLMYTNGLMITDEVAKRMGELGNITPAISVEGMREKTDERRGRGVFDKILKVMDRLYQNRVVFGISVTATRDNVEEILSDEFIDFFFKEKHASYGWIFHYLPIGRDVNFDLMPTPEQRVWMWKRGWEIKKKRKIMYADFWNDGTVSDGCIAGGREGGYFHVNWHGDVAPCVFFPYAVSNIKDIYKKGGTIDDAIRTPFFEAVRKWQFKHGYLRKNKVDGQDWLRPCPIRDHHATAWKIVKEYNAYPIDYAPEGGGDENYHRAFEPYDEQLKRLTQPIWESKYFNKRA